MAISLRDFQPHIDAGTARIRFQDPTTQPAQRQIAGQGALGNRVVEWYRGQGGAAKEENREVTRAFITLMGQMHGLDAARQIEHRLQSRLAEGKPLSGRVAAVMTREAARVEAWAKSNNEVQARALLNRLDRPSGYRDGVTVNGMTVLLRSAAADLGITDRAILDKIADPAGGQADVRRRIDRAIKGATDELGKPKALTPDAAFEIAKREINGYLVDEANKQTFTRVNARTVDRLFAPAPGGGPSVMASYARDFADVLGLNSVRTIFDDPDSAIARSTKDGLNLYLARLGGVYDASQASSLVQVRVVAEILLKTAVAAGDFDGLRLASSQPNVGGHALLTDPAGQLRDLALAESTPPETKKAYAKAVVAEGVRLGGSPERDDRVRGYNLLHDLIQHEGYDQLAPADRRTALTTYRDLDAHFGREAQVAYADLRKAATESDAAHVEAAQLRNDALGARAEADTARQAGDTEGARQHELRAEGFEKRATRLESTPSASELLIERRQAEKPGTQALTTQTDLVALALRELEASGTPTAGRSLVELVDEANRKGMPQLQAALEDLEHMERDYANLKAGPDGDRRALEGAAIENRLHLAQLRAKALELGDDAGIGAGAEQQAFIASGMRELTARMIDRAVQVLGTPPVPFAAVSLGSASRGETSPFSDVEFGIVLQRPTDAAGMDYMQKLAELVRFQVVGLGESGGPETPPGLHWDTGDLTPAENPASFVGTADELIGRSLAYGPDGGGGHEPADVYGFTLFSNTEWLYGGDGSWDIVKDMNQKVGANLDATPPGAGQTNGQALGGWLLREALIAPEGNLPSELEGADEVNVKKLSRMPMMLAYGLSLTSGAHGLDGGADAQGRDVTIAAHSTLMRVDTLKAEGVLSEAEANTLKDAFSELGRIRNQAHLKAGMGDDRVKVADYPTLPGVIAALAPFEERLKAHIDNPGRPF